MQLVRPSSVFRTYRNLEPSTVDRHSDCHWQLANFSIGEVSSQCVLPGPEKGASDALDLIFCGRFERSRGHVPDLQLRFVLGACTGRIMADINIRTQPNPSVQSMITLPEGSH